MKHTPGPWDIQGGQSIEGDLFIWQAGEYLGGHAVSRVFKDGEVCGGSVKANARLIAAAPELLEALEAMIALIYHDGDRLKKPQPGSRADVVGEYARAAIAKAKGE